MKSVKRILKITFYCLIGLWFCLIVAFFINPHKAQEVIYQYTGIELRIVEPKIFKKQTPCKEDISYGWQMQDDLTDYWQHSYENGVGKPLKFKKQITQLVEDSTLVPLKPSKYFTIDTLFHSFAVVRPQVKDFLNQLGANLQHKLKNTPYEKVQFTVTSAFRTESTVRRLMRKNKNAIKNSAHLHGTTIDISYKTFFMDNKQLSDSEAKYIKETLSQILFKMREKKKCWVKFEYFQTCYHTVVK